MLDTSVLVYVWRCGPCWPEWWPIWYSMVGCFHLRVSYGQSTTWQRLSLSRSNRWPLCSSWNHSAHLAPFFKLWRYPPSDAMLTSVISPTTVRLWREGMSYSFPYKSRGPAGCPFTLIYVDATGASSWHWSWSCGLWRLSQDSQLILPVLPPLLLSHWCHQQSRDWWLFCLQCWQCPHELRRSLSLVAMSQRCLMTQMALMLYKVTGVSESLASSLLALSCTITRSVEIHLYLNVPRQTQNNQQIHHKEVETHWRKGSQLELTTSQQN